MSPTNSPPSLSSTAITRAAAHGTKILAPTALRKSPSPIAGYTAQSTATASTKKTKKNKKNTTKLSVDFGVRPPSPNEKLYSGDLPDESPPPAVGTAKEEALQGEFDGDGVEACLSGMSIATKRPSKASGYYGIPRPGVSVSLDETAGLGRDGKI